MLDFFRFGAPINISEYSGQFLSEREGAPRAAVKRLTRQIWTQMIEMTVNAPDWYGYISLE